MSLNQSNLNQPYHLGGSRNMRIKQLLVEVEYVEES